MHMQATLHTHIACGRPASLTVAWSAGLVPITSYTKASPVPPHSPCQDAQQVPNLRETSMLFTWVQHRISLYLDQLKKHLRSITEGGNLASVIEHCMVRSGAYATSSREPGVCACMCVYTEREMRLPASTTYSERLSAVCGARAHPSCSPHGHVGQHTGGGRPRGRRCAHHVACSWPCPQYCGASLSRVGLDFQPLLQPLFEACSLQLFASHLAVAVDTFNQRLETHKWVPLPAPVMGRGKAAVQQQAQEGGERAPATSSAAAAASGGDALSPTEDESGPPYVIMEHLPLAIYTNGALTALNELRHCAMLSMSKPLAG
jgi:hypothetical protein